MLGRVGGRQRAARDVTANVFTAGAPGASVGRCSLSGAFNANSFPYGNEIEVKNSIYSIPLSFPDVVLVWTLSRATDKG